MAHCSGCGIWLRETEPFCGICGLERGETRVGAEAERDLGGETTLLTDWVAAVADAHGQSQVAHVPTGPASVLCKECGRPTTDDECSYCGYGTPAHDVHTVFKDGNWVNEIEGEGALPGTFTTKAEAMLAGRTQAVDAKTNHVIHNVDGTIGERSSFGNDPASRSG